MSAGFSVAAIRELYAHMEWADATVWRTTLTHASTAADTRLRDLLLHIHVVQRAFLNVWTDRPMHFPQPAEFPDLAAVERYGQPTYADLRAFLGTADDAALARPVVMPWVAQYEHHLGRTFSTPSLADTMFQVASHTTHHRGQVNMRLRELGVEPPLVDYIAWIWFGKPAAEWDVAPAI